MARQRGATRSTTPTPMGEIVPVRSIMIVLGWLIVSAVLVAVLLSMRYVWQTKIFLPIANVAINSEYKYVEQRELVKVIQAHTRGSWLLVDLDDVRKAGESLPWVERVEVKRVWPNKLVLNVYEHKILARWGRTQVINVAGDVLTLRVNDWPEDLVILMGAERARLALSAQLGVLTTRFSAMGLQITTLEMNKRRALTARFENGLELRVGQADIAERIARFEQVYLQKLKPYIRQIIRIDMRYGHGMAVAWKAGIKPIQLRGRG